MLIYFAGAFGKHELQRFFRLGTKILCSYYDLITPHRAYGMDKRFEEIIHKKEELNED